MDCSSDALSARPLWYVAATQPQKESTALIHLERQGFKAFYPRFRKINRHGRKANVVFAALFPGYIFVSFDIDAQPWHSIRSTFGVRHLVGYNPERPQAVPNHAIDSLLASSKAGLFNGTIRHLKPGDKVRVIEGPFADQIAIVASLSARERISLLFNILGSEREVQVPVTQIERGI